MDKKIIEASELPEGTKVYLKKDMFGYRAVEPIKDENGKLKWKRIIFGTWRERAFLLFILLIVGLGYLAFEEQINNYNKVMENPCAYCNSCQEHANQIAREITSTRPRMEFEIPFANETEDA